MSRLALLGHYGLTLYRSLSRHRLYAALNVLGLAVGIAVFMVLMLDVRFETSFDRWIPDAGNIYRFTSIFTLPGQAPDRLARSPGPIAAAFRIDYPNVGPVTRLIDGKRTVASGPLMGSESTAYVDADFFDVLNLPLAAGDVRTALADPGDVVVTQAIARKYFGTQAGPASVIGRPLSLGYHGKVRVHRVSGVLEDLLPNSNLRLGVLAPITPAMESADGGDLARWGGTPAYTFVRFRSPAEARVVQADLDRFVQRRTHGAPTGPDIGKMLRLQLTPLTSLHFADMRSRWAMAPGVDVGLVYALALVATLTLAIAALNYVNLATAQGAQRAREIAMRKVMGATRRAVALQVLAEAFAFSAAAVLVGLGLAELSLPLVNALIAGSLSLTYLGPGGVAPWALGLAVAIGLVAGAYPALFLSRFEAAPVLASARTPGGGRGEARARGVLIGAQFVIAIAFTVCALVVGAQARFVRETDRGFLRDHLILVDSLGAPALADRQTQLLDVLRSVPGVVSVTASMREPGVPSEGLEPVRPAGATTAPVALSDDLVSDDYLQTYGARLAAGRMFDRAHGQDDVAGASPYIGASGTAVRNVDVVLNESAVRALGLGSPAQALGRRLFTGGGGPDGGAGQVIGVLKDMQFGSPKRPVSAVLYRYDSQAFGGGAIGAVRFAGVDTATMMVRLQGAWRRAAVSVPFAAKTAQEGLSDYFVPDEQRDRLFAMGSLLAVGIGCVGLYGLSAFNTACRFREVGIRKTLGASTADVLKLLLAQILRPVLIANLIAWPLAWFAMRSWLAGFDQRIALSPLFFIAASVLALAVASLTVIGQSLRLATSEPARALRHE
jgi:putative ABC transport system permease protein